MAQQSGRDSDHAQRRLQSLSLSEGGPSQPEQAAGASGAGRGGASPAGREGPTHSSPPLSVHAGQYWPGVMPYMQPQMYMYPVMPGQAAYYAPGLQHQHMLQQMAAGGSPSQREHEEGFQPQLPSNLYGSSPHVPASAGSGSGPLRGSRGPQPVRRSQDKADDSQDEVQLDFPPPPPPPPPRLGSGARLAQVDRTSNASSASVGTTTSSRMPTGQVGDEGQSKAKGEGRGQNCAFFLKTGTCAYADKCKFDHPLDRIPLVRFNSLGLPLRPGEADCAYYIKNLRCGFGASCKFNHPEPVMSMWGMPPGSPMQLSGVMPYGMMPIPGSPSAGPSMGPLGRGHPMRGMPFGSPSYAMQRELWPGHLPSMGSADLHGAVVASAQPTPAVPARGSGRSGRAAGQPGSGRSVKRTASASSAAAESQDNEKPVPVAGPAQEVDVPAVAREVTKDNDAVELPAHEQPMESNQGVEAAGAELKDGTDVVTKDA